MKEEHQTSWGSVCETGFLLSCLLRITAETRYKEVRVVGFLELWLWERPALRWQMADSWGGRVLLAFFLAWVLAAPLMGREPPCVRPDQ